MRKFEFIAEGKVATIESEWPESEIGKRVLIISGKYEKTEALVVGAKMILSTYDCCTMIKEVELRVLFSEKIPGAHDMIYFMTEQEYKVNVFRW